MDTNPPFQLLTVYEDSAAGTRANDLWVRLAIELKPRLEIANDVWKFELLSHAQLRNYAAAEAATADIIMLSAQGDAELPAHVNAWLDTWLARKGRRPFALVALLSQDALRPGVPPRLGVRLRWLAKTGHLDFFCKTGDWKRSDFEYYIDTFPHRSELRSAVLEEMLHLELRSQLRQIQSRGPQDPAPRGNRRPLRPAPSPVPDLAAAN